MSDLLSDRTKFTRGFLLLLVVAVTFIFLRMIQGFLMALLLGGILAGMSQSVYRFVEARVGGRRSLAAAVTLLVVLTIVVVPALFLLGAVAVQAAQVTESAGDWVSAHPDVIGELDQALQELPFYDRVSVYRDDIVKKLGEIATGLSGYVASRLSAAAQGTVGFFFHLFVMLYATFFFLISGREEIDRFVASVPLAESDTRAILGNFVSVSRATIKGTLVVGAVQGALGGAAFAVVGLPGSFFWGTLMAFASVLPAVGPSLVWVPAALYLLVTGKVVPAIGLILWCALVVGLVDNLLRPLLVGRDTEMPDLLILLSTLGGIAMFGVVGFVVGPLIAALFLSVWKLYRKEFKTLLDPPPEEAAAEQ